MKKKKKINKKRILKSLLFTLWIIIWTVAYVKTSHPIEDSFIESGILFGWLFAFTAVAGLIGDLKE